MANEQTVGHDTVQPIKDHPRSGVEVAVLDRHGVIVSVNESWRAFAAENGGDPLNAGVGRSYLDVCAADGDDESSAEVASAIRAALTGNLPAPIAVEVPCHSPTASRWYDVLISSRLDLQGRCIGATVTFSLSWLEPKGDSALGVTVEHLRFGLLDDPLELSELRTRLTDSELHRRWLAAAAELARRILVGDPLELQAVTDAAADAADADIVTFTVLVGDTVRAEAASGPLCAQLTNNSWAAQGSLTAEVISGGEAKLVEHLSAPAHAGIDLGPTMVVPVVVGSRVRGALSVGRRTQRPAFTPGELEMAVGFARQASLVIEVIEARADQVQLVARLEDQERIARDLHDHVIGALFATGMSLHALAAQVDHREQAEKLSQVIDNLDDIIRRIRATIFGLKSADRD